MSIETILTDKAPAPIGPYSQAVKHDRYVFTSGQIGIDPRTGAVVPGGVEAETRQVFENLSAVLAAGGTSLGRVIKVTVYLVDMADFSVMNAVYAEYFGKHAPVRTTVQVCALPKDGRVEIDAIAEQ